MATLVGILVFSAPIAALAVFLTLAERREARRGAAIARQIALTDALHARLGALVAPVVRWQRGGWRVAVAVPFERPATVAAVLATVSAVFGRVRYEVVLTQQAPPAAMSRASRPARVGGESLSWT
jgi:hypothetical protein